MATATLVPVKEYLSTSYSPDREYIDGAIVERNLGERSHSKTQMEIGFWLRNRSVQLGIWVYPEQRVQVTATRFRVPDICVLAGPDFHEEVFILPPFLCIEVLSKDDRTSDTQDKIHDYLEFGVKYVWVVDPIRRRAWIHTTDGSHEAKDRVLRTQNPEIAAPLAEIFATL